MIHKKVFLTKKVNSDIIEMFYWLEIDFKSEEWAKNIKNRETLQFFFLMITEMNGRSIFYGDDAYSTTVFLSVWILIDL